MAPTATWRQIPASSASRRVPLLIEVRSSYYAPVRYPPQHKAESRAKIVGAAAELFRSGGIAATGVDAVMARAGLTAGAFYAHFDSKLSLVRDAVEVAGQRSAQKWFGRFEHLSGRAWVEELFRTYLGPEHCKDVAGGCILPSLGGEVARQPLEVRRTFSRRLAGMVELIRARAGREVGAERDEVLAAVALAVGAVVLSRAVPEPAFRREILSAARTGAQKLVALPKRRGRAARNTTGPQHQKRTGKVRKKA